MLSSKKKFKIYRYDCMRALRKMPANSIDALVTDPPAGISFMGKEWDDDKGGRKRWIAWLTGVMWECQRVMKPGAHGFVWAIPSTSHWTATALENAGFEVRDVVTHLFGSGFPKSMDISKAIDKAAGAEREVIATKKKIQSYGRDTATGYGGDFDRGGAMNLTAPSTDLAKQWQGWGTALKPASEHWILIRKPCSEKTVAKNVERWGTGGINIDASRVDLQDGETTHGSGASQSNAPTTAFGSMKAKRVGVPNIKTTQGRFPANLVLSHADHCTDSQCDIECAIAEMNRQSGHSPSNKRTSKAPKASTVASQALFRGYGSSGTADDSGGASRFFYCAKAANADKWGVCNTCNSGPIPHKDLESHRDAKHSIFAHPTVKSSKLMTYLITMITPPNGVVLDPFMGSGSTGVAALASGFKFVGIEREKEYFAIAGARLRKARDSGE